MINNLMEENFELVISYAGYSTVSLRINSNNINEFQTVKMHRRKQELKEVSILAPDKDGWEHWGRKFIEYFIGTSDMALECIIQNPEVLRFTYDKNTSQLSVYSNAPLTINNKALGYIITYQLEDFMLDFKNNVVRYMGYTGFKNTETNSQKRIRIWEKNRREAYDGSMTHFMRSLYSDSVFANGFIVHEKIRVYPEDSSFSTLYSPINQPKFARLNDKIFLIKTGPVTGLKKEPAYVDLFDTTLFSFTKATTFDKVKKQKTFYFENYLSLTYKNAFAKEDYKRQNGIPGSIKMMQTSDIMLVTEDPIVIDANGMFYNPENLLTTGYWGWDKMAGSLPSDYVYEKKE